MSLAALDERSRELVRLKFDEDLSYKEISERTGLSVGHVGRVRFEELPASLQEQMLSVKLASVLIETDVPNEARDLFIRLQAGMPLNSQEKRDAWPGNFTEAAFR